MVNSGATLRNAIANPIQNNVVLTINAGGTFDMNGQSDAIGGLSGGGNVIMSAGLNLDGSSPSAALAKTPPTPSPVVHVVTCLQKMS